MVREKQTEQVKHWVLSVYTIGRASCLTLLLEKHVFARIVVLTNTGYIRWFVDLSFTDFLMIVRKSRDSWEFSEDRHPQNSSKIFKIFRGSSPSEFSEDHHPQNFLRIVILRISKDPEDPQPRTFWGSSEFSEDRHPQNFLSILRGSSSSEFSEDRHPQNFLRIIRIFWGSSSSEFSEHPQNFLRIIILRIFWGSSSSEFSEDCHPQFPEDPLNFHSISVLLMKCAKKKRVFSNKKTLIEWKFWGPSENSEDDDFFKFSEDDLEDPHPQKLLRILRKFWGRRCLENSEDDDPQKILNMRILRKSEGEDPQKILRSLREFWGWWSSEHSEDPQKILKVRILKKIWRFLRKVWRLLRKFWGFLNRLWGVSRIVW